jgi:hypothetical protein
MLDSLGMLDGLGMLGAPTVPLRLTLLSLPPSLVNFSIPGYFSIFGNAREPAGFLDSSRVRYS